MFVEKIKAISEKVLECSDVHLIRSMLMFVEKDKSFFRKGIGVQWCKLDIINKSVLCCLLCVFAFCPWTYCNTVSLSGSFSYTLSWCLCLSVWILLLHLVLELLSLCLSLSPKLCPGTSVSLSLCLDLSPTLCPGISVSVSESFSYTLSWNLCLSVSVAGSFS